MEANPMLSTDTSMMFGHFLKNKAIFELFSLTYDDIHMQVSIADVSVSHYQRLRFFSQLF
jgi:hypothetical protein